MKCSELLLNGQKDGRLFTTNGGWTEGGECLMLFGDGQNGRECLKLLVDGKI